MKTNLAIPEVALIAITRAMLGAGIALLNARKLSPEQQQAIGWTLAGVGALTTVPLALEMLGSMNGRCGND